MPSDYVPIVFGIFFIAIVALAIVGAIAGAKAAKKRQEELAALAREFGFSFNADNDDSVSGRLSNFSPFAMGSKRVGYNTLVGGTTAIGRPIAFRIGDYRYETESGSGKDRTTTTHHLSYLHARLPYVVAAKLAVRREGFFDKIAGAIGFEDIDFESAQFSKKFHVSSADRKVAYDLFDPRMIEWYLAGDPPALQIVGRDLVLTTGGTWTPAQYRERYAWAMGFLERWPEHLVERLEAAR